MVGQALAVGVGVNRAHHAVLDAKMPVQDLGKGSQAVGCAGCVGNDVMEGVIIIFFIDAHDNCDVLILGGSGNDHLFRAGIQVSLSQFPGPVLAGALNHNVDVLFFPG
ncbi:hypothetical protein SDC9_172781 [bioreactor metagenome]|uniref:Uncharacterized protein n=1 Tax=bioreactor metagenome TaxID=1076179 RepID=A0A645GHB3_9ZZZZ